MPLDDANAFVQLDRASAPQNTDFGSIGSTHSFAVVDLCPLQPVGVIHVDCFPLGVKVDGSATAFAVSIAGCFGATEGQVNFGANGGRIDVGDAGVQVAHGPEGVVDILCIEGGGEPILDSVGDLDRFFKAAAGNDADDRTKDLFLGDTHFGRHIGVDRWFEEVAVATFVAIGTIAAAEQLCSFFIANLYISGSGLDLLLVDLRAHVAVLVESIANVQFFSALREPLYEFVINALLGDDAAGGSAALSSGAEGSPDGSFDGKVEVGIVEDNHGVFA